MDNVINVGDRRYPKLLNKIGKEAPKKLYYKGQWDNEIFKNCLAVVGSRQMTSYGKRAVEQIVTEAAASGITIISGFMYGVDAAAHAAALSVANGRTIAVMPCGIDLIHPEYQQDLYSQILNNKGLVISEYEGEFAPALWTYPKRNRIIAGLSKAVLVVEAALKSGSLITADFAKKYGRKVFAVPGSVTSTVSEGTNQLLKEGAALASSSKDILDYYAEQGFSLRFTPKGPYAPQKNPNLGGLERQIIEQLQREPLEIDVLARTFKTPVSKLGVVLSMMQLRGLIKQEGNKFYVG